MSERQRVQQQRIQQVLQYLEQHLDDAIDLPLLAAIACYSQYHFHRIFRAWVGDYQSAASQAWSTIMGYAYGQKLMTAKVDMFGICLDDPTVTEPERIRYQAGLNLEPHVLPQSAKGEVFIGELAGGRYAMAVHRGAYDNLNQTYDYLFSTWLEKSGEQLRDTPCFERYLNRDPRRTKPENLKTEIYIPLR